MARPSRGTVGRAGLRGLATLAWWPCGPSNGFCAASSHGVALPRAFLGLLCRDRTSLFSEATAAGLCGLPPPAPEKVFSVLGERPRVTAWFGAVRGCGPRRGSPPGSGGLRAQGAGAWRSRGELRQESQGSRARRTQRLWESCGSKRPSQNPQSRVRQALLQGVASAAKALGLLVSTSLGWTLSPGQLAVSDGVGIVFGSE